jgi:pilus assembly protein CpaC
MTKMFLRMIRKWNVKALAWTASGALGLAVVAFAQELPAIPQPPTAPPAIDSPSVRTEAPPPRIIEGGDDESVPTPPPAGPSVAPRSGSTKGVVVFTEVPQAPVAPPIPLPGEGSQPPAPPETPPIPMPVAAPNELPGIPQPPLEPSAPPVRSTPIQITEPAPAPPIPKTVQAPPSIAPAPPAIAPPPLPTMVPAPDVSKPRLRTANSMPTVPPIAGPSAEIRPVAFQEPKLPEKVKADPVPAEVAPPPRPIDLFGGNHPRLQRLPGVQGPLGTTPVPSKKDLEEYNRYVKEFVDPRNTLDLVQGRTRLMVLSEVPKRIQVGNETIAIYNLVTPKEITILGKQVGTTILNLWFTDPENKEREKILSYLVRVIPDPEEKERLENVYKALQDEINRTFPDSLVHLKLVGDKLVVSGQVHDITQAMHILNIVKSNAPGGNQDKDSLDPAKIPVGRDATVRPGDPGNAGGTPGLEDFKLAGGPHVINLLRIPGEQQVMLRVTVAEVNRSAARSIGLNFAVNNAAGTTVFQNRTGNIATGGPLASFGFGGLTTATGLASNFAGLSTNNLPISLDGGQVSLAINALRNISYARSLAEPNLVAMNGQTATFHAGGQFPVPVVTGNTFSGLQGANFVPYGVNLQFTPFVLDRDRIRLNVGATVSTRDLTTGSSIGGSFVSGLSSRNFQTTVELREGQTLAVAGLIQNNLGTDATRVPWFGDIPILNRLAGFDRTSAGEQEVVVLITPELVHPMDCKEAANMPLPGADLFEPSDLEFYLLGRLESRRPYDYRSPVMNDWDRMRSYKQCEQLYIFGPSGYGN